MKTPFYIIKRTPVTKETAMEKWDALTTRDTPLRADAAALIHFCLNHSTEEKVYIEVGTRVRIKSMPEGKFHYSTPGVGASAIVDNVHLNSHFAALGLGTTDDYNAIRITDGNLDLSAYLELV